MAVFCPISYFFQKCAYHILWFYSGIQNPVAQILMRNLGAFPTQILVLNYNRESTVKKSLTFSTLIISSHCIWLQKKKTKKIEVIMTDNMVMIQIFLPEYWIQEMIWIFVLCEKITWEFDLLCSFVRLLVTWSKLTCDGSHAGVRGNPRYQHNKGRSLPKHLNKLQY